MRDYFHHLQIQTLPPSTERLPLFVVGDVHGCADELSTLIHEAQKYLKDFQLVLVGDLFTKGPDPIGVYNLIQDHDGICIQGNHDWALTTLLKKMRQRDEGQIKMSTHMQQTLRLIRHHKKSLLSWMQTLPHALISTITPAPSVGWEDSEYPLVVVHAGLDPTRGLWKTSERMLLTARYVRFDEQYNLVVAAPGENAFRWHTLHEGPETIIFGHDAKQGLFRKTLPNGRPICVGVDTGCTYGHSLTGYFVEYDKAVQVRSKRLYFDVVDNKILLSTSA